MCSNIFITRLMSKRSPGQKAVKRLCVCVRACVLVYFYICCGHLRHRPKYYFHSISVSTKFALLYPVAEMLICDRSGSTFRASLS